MAGSPTPVLELCRVLKRYGDSPALDVMDLSVAEGEAVALVGPSGSGKTTALKLLNGLLQPDAGSVEIEGRNLAQLDLIAHRRRTGTVIQEGGLLPHWSVERNIATVLLLEGARLASVRARVAELLEAVQLDPALGQRRPWQLSGGQRQRVGIARALAGEPRFLLMDEPFGAVDPLTRAHLRQLVRDLRRRASLTLLLVTHDLEDARALADRVCVMKAGKVVESLPSQRLHSARDPWVRQFLDAASVEPNA